MFVPARGSCVVAPAAPAPPRSTPPPPHPPRPARPPRRRPGIDLGLAYPLAQRLRVHPQPARDRLHRRPLRVVILTVLAHQPHRPGLGVLVVPDRHRAILPNKGSAQETGDGSPGT